MNAIFIRAYQKNDVPAMTTIPTHGIFMNELDFSRLAVFQTVFA